ncbi:MAG: NAD(P)-dependent oxidoreductase [Acidimicrobiia bacterium]
MLVVYTDAADLDPGPGIALLVGAGYEVVRLETQDAEEIAVGAARAAALVVGYAPIGKDLLARLPEVEVVSIMATGFEHIDLEAAAARGVCVANVGGAAAPDVAAHALALTLALIRGLPRYLIAAQQQEWFRLPPLVPPRTTELVLGVLGRGRIGTQIMTMAGNVFGSVQFHDPAPGIDGSISLPHVLATSDVVVLTLPLTPATAGLADRGFFEQMKKGSYLVNVSRGGLVNSRDLRAAVENGKLRGAAVDVLDQEPPPPDHPLLGHPQILVTPHTAYLSDRTEKMYATVAAQNVLDWFTGSEIVNAVNGITRRMPSAKER